MIDRQKDKKKRMDNSVVADTLRIVVCLLLVNVL